MTKYTDAALREILTARGTKIEGIEGHLIYSPEFRSLAAFALEARRALRRVRREMVLSGGWEHELGIIDRALTGARGKAGR